MAIKIPTYEDRLSPEGLVTPRASPVEISSAVGQGMQNFGNSVATFGATQLHLERQVSNGAAMLDATKRIQDADLTYRQSVIDAQNSADENGNIKQQDGSFLPYATHMKNKGDEIFGGIAAQYKNQPGVVQQSVETAVMRQRFTAEDQSIQAGEIIRQQGAKTSLEEIKKNSATFALTDHRLFESEAEKFKLALSGANLPLADRMKIYNDGLSYIAQSAIDGMKARNEPDLIPALRERMNGLLKNPPGGSAALTDTPAGGTPGTQVKTRFQDINPKDYKSPYEFAKAYSGAHENVDTTALQAFVKFNPQTTPWCAGFVNGVLNGFGLGGTGSPGAKSFLKYGTATDAPKEGDIVVLNRGGDPNKGHVGFFAGYDGNGNIRVFGGNQSDSVKESVFNKADVAGYRTYDQGAIATFATQNPTMIQMPVINPTINPGVTNVLSHINPSNILPQLHSAVSEQHKMAAQMASVMETNITNDVTAIRNGQKSINEMPSYTRQEVMAAHPFDGHIRYDNYLQERVTANIQSTMAKMTPQDRQESISSNAPTDVNSPTYSAQLKRQQDLIKHSNDLVIAAEKDPQGYAQSYLKQGKPLNLNNLDELKIGLQQRADTNTYMQDNFGTKSRVFTLAEEKLISEHLHTLTPNQQLSYLQTFALAVPDTKDLRELMQRIQPDRPEMVHAALLSLQQNTIEQDTGSLWWKGTATVAQPIEGARLIVAGTKITNPSTVDKKEDGKSSLLHMILPKQDAFDKEAGKYGEVFRGNPDGMRQFTQTVKAAYVGRMAEQGKFDPDVNQTIDKDVFEYALNVTTGGIDKDQYKVIRAEPELIES